MIGLTQVRDSLGLDEAIVTLLREAMAACHGQLPARAGIVGLREVVAKYKYPNAVTANPLLDWLDDATCQSIAQILQDQREGYHVLQAADVWWTVLVLKPNIQYKHAAVVMQSRPLDEDGQQLLSECMTLFHHYANLISENERDALTGLLNRKTFDNAVSKLVLSQRVSADLSAQQHYLAIFDIDFFKRINDNYGHLIGDEVLLLLSQLMTQTFRESDLLFRFGGEEFVGLFATSTLSDVTHALERFRHTLSKYAFPQVGKVTVSIGFARLSLDTLPNMTLDQADQALYYAKANGRDRICGYEQLLAAGLLNVQALQGEIELF